MTELERMEQAEGYINRYYEFEEGVTVTYENKEYLKTYIRDISEIEKEFEFKKKVTKTAMNTAIWAGIFAGLLAIPFHKKFYLLVPIVCFVAIMVASIMISISVNKLRLEEAKKNQKDVNEGIKEQIEIIDIRIQQVEKQRDDYLTALKKRIDFMDLNEDYMENIGTIKGYLESGEAETCEDAVALYEQHLILNQMTKIMKKSERKIETDPEKNKERFGDPLKIIEENKKKKKQEKKDKKKKLFG